MASTPGDKAKYRRLRHQGMSHAEAVAHSATTRSADLGDSVNTAGGAPAAPPAATATAAAGATPTKAEFDALLADVNALRTNLAALRTALTGPGKALN